MHSRAFTWILAALLGIGVPATGWAQGDSPGDQARPGEFVIQSAVAEIRLTCTNTQLAEEIVFIGHDKATTGADDLENLLVVTAEPIVVVVQ